MHVLALILLARESRGDSAAGAAVTCWLETVRAVSSDYGALWFREPGSAEVGDAGDVVDTERAESDGPRDGAVRDQCALCSVHFG